VLIVDEAHNLEWDAFEEVACWATWSRQGFYRSCWPVSPSWTGS
jgi:hypothetical protein